MSQFPMKNLILKSHPSENRNTGRKPPISALLGHPRRKGIFIGNWLISAFVLAFSFFVYVGGFYGGGHLQSNAPSIKSTQRGCAWGFLFSGFV
jgi:hypothetical protein